MLECVVNVSEGRDEAVLAALEEACAGALLDRHTDADHNRSVLTLLGEDAPRALATAAVELIDISTHSGVHPRIGAVDVVPFVALGNTPAAEAVRARDDFARWAGAELNLPCFLYGQGQASLPEIRRRAFVDLEPAEGPDRPHPTAGACAVGAREVLVAYNLWLADAGLETATRIAGELRGPHVRALGLDVGGQAQVSMNLVAPAQVGPADVFDAVAAEAAVERAELVGLVPQAVLDAVPPGRWAELDLAADRTIEARAAGAEP